MSFSIIDSDNERCRQWIAKHNKTVLGDINDGYIGLDKDGDLVAVVHYEKYMVGSVTCHIAISGRINRQFLWFIFYYPFEQLKVKKILAPVQSTNERALKFDKHLGFELEHVIQDAGINCDLHLLSMTKEQCRFI